MNVDSFLFVKIIVNSWIYSICILNKIASFYMEKNLIFPLFFSLVRFSKHKLLNSEKRHDRDLRLYRPKKTQDRNLTARQIRKSPATTSKTTTKRYPHYFPQTRSIAHICPYTHTPYPGHICKHTPAKHFTVGEQKPLERAHPPLPTKRRARFCFNDDSN